MLYLCEIKFFRNLWGILGLHNYFYDNSFLFELTVHHLRKRGKKWEKILGYINNANQRSLRYIHEGVG